MSVTLNVRMHHRADSHLPYIVFANGTHAPPVELMITQVHPFPTLEILSESEAHDRAGRGERAASGKCSFAKVKMNAAA